MSAWCSLRSSCLLSARIKRRTTQLAYRRDNVGVRWGRRIAWFAVGIAAGLLVLVGVRSFEDPAKALREQASAVTMTYLTNAGETSLTRQIVLPRTTVSQADKHLKRDLTQEKGWIRTGMRGGEVSYRRSTGLIRTVELRSRRLDGKHAVVIFEYGAFAPWQKGWFWLKHRGVDPAAKPEGYVEIESPRPQRLEPVPERDDVFRP